MKIREDWGVWHEAATDYQNLAAIAKEQGKLNDAFLYLDKALKIYERVKDNYHIAEICYSLALISKEKINLKKPKIII